MDDGEIAIEPGPADDPAFVMFTDLGTLLGLGIGENSLDEEVAGGRVRVEGAHDGARRAAELFVPARPLADDHAVEAARALGGATPPRA